jgi:quinol monooxygenase YgiN
VYARVHTVETTPEQHREGVELSRAQLVPWTREASGFCGLISLFDRSQGVTLVISLWADEESLQASAAAGDRLSALVAEATGARRRSLDDYEVSLFEVPQRDPGSGS